MWMRPLIKLSILRAAVQGETPNLHGIFRLRYGRLGRRHRGRSEAAKNQRGTFLIIKLVSRCSHPDGQKVNPSDKSCVLLVRARLLQGPHLALFGLARYDAYPKAPDLMAFNIRLTHALHRLAASALLSTSRPRSCCPKSIATMVGPSFSVSAFQAWRRLPRCCSNGNPSRKLRSVH